MMAAARVLKSAQTAPAAPPATAPPGRPSVLSGDIRTPAPKADRPGGLLNARSILTLEASDNLQEAIERSAKIAALLRLAVVGYTYAAEEEGIEAAGDLALLDELAHAGALAAFEAERLYGEERFGKELGYPTVMRRSMTPGRPEDGAAT